MSFALMVYVPIEEPAPQTEDEELLTAGAASAAVKKRGDSIVKIERPDKTRDRL